MLTMDFAQVLGMTEIEALELLMSLEERDITRHNRAFNRFSCNPQMMVGLCEEAQGSGAQLRAAAITAFAEYCLHVADNAAALNASNAQVSIHCVPETPFHDDRVAAASGKNCPRRFPTKLLGLYHRSVSV